MQTVVLPPSLDPLQDSHGAAFAEHLPLRDGDRVALPPGLTYVFIVFTNRSGSTYLGELLGSTGFFNRAGEPLNSDVVLKACAEQRFGSFSQYFAALAARQSRNGHFVVKASVGQLAVLAHHGILPRIIERSRFLVAERMDKLAQAISWAIAAQTGRYTSRQPGQPDATPQFHGAGLRRHLQSVVEIHADISLFMTLNGIIPFHITYEMLTAHPLLAGQMVCAYLGHPELRCDLSKIGLEKQATEVNRAWRARFLAEQPKLRRTGGALAVVTALPAPPATVRYRVVDLEALADDPHMRIGERSVAERFEAMPACTLAIPPLGFGEVDAPDAAAATVAHPAVPAWLLRNVTVHGRFGIVTARDRVLAETLLDVALETLPGAGRDDEQAIRLPERPPAANIHSAFHLLGGRLDDPASWLLDLAARFVPAAFDRLRSGHDASPAPVVLVPPLDLFWKWESLSLILPDPVPRVAVNAEGDVFAQRLLYLPGLAGAGWTTHPATARLFDVMRDAVAGPPSGHPNRARRLFVMGPHAPANGGELLARAQRAGFEVITPRSLPFAEQVRMFAEASHVVAAHGAELADLAFCRRGTALCELRPDRATPPVYRHLAAMRGVRYGRLTGVPAGDGWRVSTEAFDAVLRHRDFLGG